MPYIPQSRRKDFEKEVNALVDLANRETLDTGDINYIVSKFIFAIYDKNPSYGQGSKVRAALSDAAEEFYRRKLADYEDKKKAENGDI
jgi:hypothetical protein